MPLKITPDIHLSLERLEDRRKQLLELGATMMGAYEGAIYPVDLLAIGALKRTISTIAGFKQLVTASNMICARTILRTQIDTAIRFYSVFIVSDPHFYSLAILNGKQINYMKDSNGEKMRDAYLVKRISEEHSWVSNVYKNLSGYIHLSDSHIISPIEQFDDESTTISLSIQDEDAKFPESSWIEVIDCMSESIDIFVKYLEGWIFTKDNPEAVAQFKKEMDGKPGD